MVVVVVAVTDVVLEVFVVVLPVVVVEIFVVVVGIVCVVTVVFVVEVELVVIRVVRISWHTEKLYLSVEFVETAKLYHTPLY
jgi:hypothetical protein